MDENAHHADGGNGVSAPVQGVPRPELDRSDRGGVFDEVVTRLARCHPSAIDIEK